MDALKIISLRSENIKRLKAVEIRPDGNMVQITGKNGQGKTSVLDSILWALAGQGVVQSVPIRKGETQARIRLDMGELIVTRYFTQEPGDVEATTSLKVENAEGFSPKKPQALLDSLVDSLSFDPLAFKSLSPGQQFETLKGFVPGVDFDAIDKAIKADFEARTELNRVAASTQAAADAVKIPETVPEEPLEEQALMVQLEEAGKTNTEIERRKANRVSVALKIDTLRDLATDRRAEATQLRQRADDLDGSASETTQQADELQAKLDGADPLPEPVETSKLMARIADAKLVALAAVRRQEKERLGAQAKTLRDKADALTTQISAARDARQKAIAAAQMPVPGLSLGDSVVLMNGIPFDQASDAEQLRISIAIAMAGNPKLRVIRVRDGSLLDEDGMKILADAAADQGYQFWIERVDNSGSVGFVIEDGRLKGQEIEPDLEDAPKRRKKASASDEPEVQTAADLEKDNG